MSKLEDLLAAQLEAAGIRFDREFVFCPWRKFRADFSIKGFWRKSLMSYYDPQLPDEDTRELKDIEDHQRLLVEVQGFSPSGHHGSGFSQAHSDAEKLSLASCLGYRTIHATGKQVRDGSALAWIRVALGLEDPESLHNLGRSCSPASKERRRSTSTTPKTRRRSTPPRPRLPVALSGGSGGSPTFSGDVRGSGSSPRSGACFPVSAPNPQTLGDKSPTYSEAARRLPLRVRKAAGL